MKKVLITGATGLIGKKIAEKLIDRGDIVTVFSRSADKARRIIPGAAQYVDWNYRENAWQVYLDGIDAVIHLAGENVMAKRWNKEHKANILNSRVEPTRALVDAIGNALMKPEVFISASAIGYYGNSEIPVTEESLPGKDFLADVVGAWEAETKKIDRNNVRRVNVRTGIVLDKNEGALAQMITPFKYFVGGPIGSGNQWFPWIHIDDVSEIFLHVLDNKNVHGIINAVSPNTIRMEEFCRILGRVMRRPSLFKVPPFALRILFGEGADVLLSGAHVIPERTLQSGYQFKYTNAEEALREILRAHK